MLSFIAYVSIAIIINFLLTCFIQAFIHKFVGHNKKTIFTWIYASHTGSHHTIYTRHTFESDKYSDKETSVTFELVPVAVCLLLIIYLILPAYLFYVSLITVAISFSAHVYLHVQFHLKESWLLKYEWFRTLKEIHRVHHVNPSYNYGILNFLTDRLFGSYLEPK